MSRRCKVLEVGICWEGHERGEAERRRPEFQGTDFGVVLSTMKGRVSTKRGGV